MEGVMMPDQSEAMDSLSEGFSARQAEQAQHPDVSGRPFVPASGRRLGLAIARKSLPSDERLRI
jgi:hypothetical protein